MKFNAGILLLAASAAEAYTRLDKANAVCFLRLPLIQVQICFSSSDTLPLLPGHALHRRSGGSLQHRP